MGRWIVVLLLLSMVGLVARQASALPPPPPADRAEWSWDPLPVYYDLDPSVVKGEAPFVPAGATWTTGPVVIAPQRAALVWMPAFATVRVRKTRAGAQGKLHFSRVEPGPGHARIDEPAALLEPGAWLLRHPAGWGAPWLVECDRYVEIVVERAIPRQGERIWEKVHDEVLAWIEQEGPLPRLPAGPGSERYLRRRLADLELAKEVERLPGYGPAEAGALETWRLYRASLELEALRPLDQVELIAPRGTAEVGLPHLLEEGPSTDAGDLPRRARVSSDRPWDFRVRGPAVLRLGARALLSPAGPSSQPLSVVVKARDEAGHEHIIARLDTIAHALRTRDLTSRDRPIPVLVDALTTTGERVSVEHSLSVPLEAGLHGYRVEVRGGAVAMRARLGRIAPRAHGRASAKWRARVHRRALSDLGERNTIAAEVIAALLTDPWSVAPALPTELERTLERQAPRTRAWLAFEALRTQDLDDTRRTAEARRIVRWLPITGRPDALDTELRIEAFEQHLAAGHSDLAVETLRSHARWLNGDELPALVDAVGAQWSWPMVGALDAVEARAPLADRLRGAHARLWTWTRWTPLQPIGDVDPWHWIEPPLALVDPATEEPAAGMLWSMPSGTPTTLLAEPHPYEAARTPVLQLQLHATRPIEGDLRLQVDELAYTAPMVDGSALFEVAVPVGPHEVRLDVPDGVRAFSNLHPAKEPAKGKQSPPWLTTMWPTSDRGQPVAFELGVLPRDTLVQVDLRVLDAPAILEDPIVAWICFDDGLRHRVSILPNATRADVLSLASAPTASDRMRVAVRASRRATRVWVETAGPVRLAVGARVRRWELPPGAAVGARPAASKLPGADTTTLGSPTSEGTIPRGTPQASADDPYALLHASSIRVAETPGSARLRIEHAERLIDVGEIRRAQQQLLHVLEAETIDSAHALLPAVLGLQARIDAFITDDYVTLASTSAEPLLLRPAISAFDPTDPNRAPVAAANKAEHEGRMREAFEGYTRAYTDTGTLAAGYAAALLYAEALRNAPLGSPEPWLEPLQPLVYGLTSELRTQIDTPRLRWLHNQMAGTGQWESLRLAEQSAGTLDRGRPTPQDVPSDGARLQWALLAPPWGSSDGPLLRSGSKAVIKLEQGEPTTIELEVFCDDLGAPDRVSSVRLRAGDPAAPHTERTLEVPPRTVTKTTLGSQTNAMRLELELPAGGEESRCALRWGLLEPDETPSPAVRTVRPTRWLRAEPGSPVEVIVLGPTAVRLTLEAQDERSLATLAATVETTDLAGQDPQTPRIRRVAAAGHPPGPITATLLVLGAGPQRIVVHTDTPGLLVHPAMSTGSKDAVRLASMDVDPGVASEEEQAAPALLLRPDLEGARPYWPAGSSTRPVERIVDADADEPWKIGSFTVELGSSRNDITERDDPRPRNQLRGSVLWRRELSHDHVWVKLSSHGQLREDAGAAGGGGATLYAQRGPRRIRGWASISGWSETYAGAPAWGLRAAAHVDRPVGLGPSLALVPYLRGEYRYQSLANSDVDLRAESSHPEVFSGYIEDHPLAITPGLRLRWFIFQDLLLVGEVDTTPNSNFRSVDHANATVDLQGIIDTRFPLLLRYGGGYGASIRFEDEDRARAFFRSSPGVNAGITYMIGAVGRLNLDLRDTLYISRSLPTRNGLDVVLSFDLTLGRGVRDISPMELLFRPLYRYQWWREPPPEAKR